MQVFLQTFLKKDFAVSFFFVIFVTMNVIN